MITSQKDYEKALEMIQEGITHNEFNAELHYLKGLALEKLKDDERISPAEIKFNTMALEELKAVQEKKVKTKNF